MICDWWILIRFVCFNRFFSCDHNYVRLTAPNNTIVKAAFELCWFLKSAVTNVFCNCFLIRWELTMRKVALVNWH